MSQKSSRQANVVPPWDTPNGGSGCEWFVWFHWGDQSAEESRRLREWLDASAENREDYESAEYVWHMSGSLPEDRRIRADLEAARRMAASFRKAPLPFTYLAQLLKLFVTRRHYTNVISPQIADIQDEYTRASTAGRIWMARWILIRGLASLMHKPLWLWAWALVTRTVDAIFRT